MLISSLLYMCGGLVAGLLGRRPCRVLATRLDAAGRGQVTLNEMRCLLSGRSHADFWQRYLRTLSHASVWLLSRLCLLAAQLAIVAIVYLLLSMWVEESQLLCELFFSIGALFGTVGLTRTVTEKRFASAS